MRLVVDCNVVISAALTPDGVAAKALRKAEAFHTVLASAFNPFQNIPIISPKDFIDQF